MSGRKSLAAGAQISPHAFFIVTLGCKVNQYEAQALREAWTSAGLAECGTPGEADEIIIHSCAVTANAVADTRAMLRRMHRAAPKAAIRVMGCAAEVCPEKLTALPGVAEVIQREGKTAFILAGPEDRAPTGGNATPKIPGPSFIPGPDGELDPSPDLIVDQTIAPSPSQGPVLLFPPLAISGYARARAVVKIQDGCSHGCTYCIVPLTRGRSVSRPPEDILAEMRRLHAAGFSELILSGINLRQYGRDFPKGSAIRDFWELLTFLEKNLAPDWVGRARWRLSSLEPGQLDEAALEALSNSRMVTPHLHISLQSGSPTVLKRMGRGHYRPGALPDFLATLRRAWPVMGLGADILVGFPGESEAEFEETRALAQALPLTYAHVFPFSPRPGTAAATLPEPTPFKTAEERAASIRNIAATKKNTFLAMLLARASESPPLRMVLESRESGLGVSEYYAACRLPPQELTEGTAPSNLLTVRPLCIEDGLLLVTRL